MSATPLLAAPCLMAHTQPAWVGFAALEWGVVVLSSLLVAWCLWRAVCHSLHPGEQEPDHPKRLIFAGPSSAAATAEPNPQVADSISAEVGVRPPSTEERA